MDKKIIFYGLIVFGLLALSSLVFAQTTNINYADEINITTGNITLGALSDTKVFNSNFLRVQESNENIGLYFEISFNNIQGNLSTLTTNQRYVGGASHEVFFEVYDFDLNDWVFLYEYKNSPNFESHSFSLNESNNNNGEVLLRYNHPDSGFTGHYFDVDYLVITSEVTEVINVVNGFNFMDLENTFNIIMIVLMLLLGLFLVLSSYNVVLGSGIIMIVGFVLFFSGFSLIFTTLIIAIGISSLFRE